MRRSAYICAIIQCDFGRWEIREIRLFGDHETPQLKIGQAFASIISATTSDIETAKEECRIELQRTHPDMVPYVAGW